MYTCAADKDIKIVLCVSNSSVTGLLNVELMQIMKFDIARIKAVEFFRGDMSTFQTFLSIF